jgi:hypothetical protein
VKKLSIITIAASAVLPAFSLAQDAPSPYAGMAFLAGSCWKGDLPQQGKLSQSDEHCFTWVYGGKFLRDRHVVHSSDGRPDYLGETVYFWDASSKQVHYLYVESDGGHSEGSVSLADTGLIFPDTEYSDEGQKMTYRSRWQRAGDSAYDVVTEFKQPDGSWKLGWKVHMVKGAAAKG